MRSINSTCKVYCNAALDSPALHPGSVSHMSSLSAIRAQLFGWPKPTPRTCKIFRQAVLRFLSPALSTGIMSSSIQMDPALIRRFIDNPEVLQNEHIKYLPPYDRRNGPMIMM